MQQNDSPQTTEDGQRSVCADIHHMRDCFRGAKVTVPKLGSIDGFGQATIIAGPGGTFAITTQNRQ